VVCAVCGGSGCERITYIPFMKRKRKRGVQRVIAGGGLWFARRGDEKTISAAEFYAVDEIVWMP
jgi:hypothetical protein